MIPIRYNRPGLGGRGLLGVLCGVLLRNKNRLLLIRIGFGVFQSLFLHSLGSLGGLGRFGCFRDRLRGRDLPFAFKSKHKKILKKRYERGEPCWGCAQVS